MLIIEGPDLVGKTVLAKALSESIGWQYCHLTRLADDFHRYFDYLPMIKPGTIRDRFHMSEIAYCYARKENPADSLPVHWYIALDRMLLTRAVRTILITADPEVIAHRYREDPHREMYDLETILRANEAYMKIAERKFEPYVPWFDLHFHAHHNSDFVNPRDSAIHTLVHELQCAQNIASYLKSTEGFAVSQLELLETGFDSQS